MPGDCRRAIARFLVILTAVLAIGTGVAGAQTAPQPAAAPAGSGGPDLPRAVIDAILSSSPDALTELNRYLGASTLTPAQIADRAAALINALGKQAGALKPQDVALTMSRITVFTSRLLAKASVIRFAVDGSYRPPAGAVALAFGSPGAPTHPGFTKVTATDPRISGVNLVNVSAANHPPGMASGIAGVRKIHLRVRPGDYRLVLMTQQLGDAKLKHAPFGRSLRINGVPVLVARSDPSQWIGGAVLTNRGNQFIGGKGHAVGGFLSGQFDSSADALIAAQRGGVLVVEVRAPDGLVQIETSEFGTDQSYLTGLLLEPKGKRSDLVLQGGTFAAILPLEVRLALEARVLAAAAAVLGQVQPAAGPGPNVPAPQFEATEAVSSS